MVEEQTPKTKTSRKKFFILCGVLVVLIIIGISMGTCPGGTTTETTPSVTIGSEAFIRAGNLDTVYLAVDKQSMDMWAKAGLAKDYIGMAQLEASGRIFPVPNGTKVLVIDSSFTLRKVRVLEGDAYGKSGWLPYEWVE